MKELADRVDAAVESINQSLAILVTDPETAESSEVEELREIRAGLIEARSLGDLEAVDRGFERLRDVTRRLLGIDRANP